MGLLVTPELGSLVGAGLLAGALHALGPDHLVTVTSLASGSRRHAARIGIFWGLGHALGALVLGLIFVAGGALLDIELGSTIAERGVGIVLMLLGARTLLPFLRGSLTAHAHTHGGETHSHLHAEGQPHDHREGLSTGIGFLHGIAGLPHLLAIAPSLLLEPHAAVFFVTAFSLGTIGAMGTVAVAWRSFVLRTGRHHGRLLEHRLSAGLGFSAVLLGLYWLQ